MADDRPANEPGVVTKLSPRPVADTTARLTGILGAKGVKLFTVIDQSAENISAITKKDRSKELFLYSVSEPYLTLRYRLGISIGE